MDDHILFSDGLFVSMRVYFLERVVGEMDLGARPMPAFCNIW